MASITATRLEEELPGAAEIHAKLHRAWKKEHHFQHTRGLCHLVVWLVALVLLDLLVDWFFRVPGYWRLVLPAVNVAALGWVLWHHWLRFLRRYDAVRTALKVEGRHPELQSLLVSFVQFAQGPAPAAHISPSLIRALRRQTIEYTDPIDFREIISYRALRPIFILSACVIAFFAVVSVNWSEHFKVLVRRMLNPQAAERYPTRTRIIDLSRDATAQYGTKVTLWALAAGQLPSRGTLYFRSQAGVWEPLDFAKAEATDVGARYAHDFAELYQGFDYRLRIGDDSSDEYRVTIVPPPRVVGTRVFLEYPKYTGLRPDTLDILNLEVPEGTKIRWELRCDQALKSAEVIREGDKTSPMTLSGDGRIASFQTTAATSFDYSFKWTEREHGYEYKDEVRYFVQVVPDSAPQVEITRPLEDEKATVRKALAVTYNARDDYGLTEAWIAYNVNDGEEKKVSIGTLKGRTIEGTEATWVPKKSILDLKEGDTVTYLIEVADNHVGEGGAFKTRSQARRLYIVSIEEYLRYLAERRRKLIDDIRTMHTQETQAGEKVDEIKSKSPE